MEKEKERGGEWGPEGKMEGRRAHFLFAAMLRRVLPAGMDTVLPQTLCARNKTQNMCTQQVTSCPRRKTRISIGPKMKFKQQKECH